MEQALLSSNKDGWQTPPDVLSVVTSMDIIGLDPATTSDNPVGATSFYTPKEDGLSKSWVGHGLVFVNPPYGRSLPKWVKKARLEAARDAEIIMLVPSRTDTRWMQDWALEYSSAVCFWKGRIHFIDPETGKPAKVWSSKHNKYINSVAPFPSAFLYYGPRSLSFRATFAAYGRTYTADL